MRLLSFTAQQKLLFGLTAFAALSGSLTNATYVDEEGVNVAVRASWTSAPLILELLECTAIENPASYYPLLRSIASGKLDLGSKDQTLYEEFVKIVGLEGALTEDVELDSFHLSLSVREASPRIEAQFQYYNNTINFLKGIDCPVWFDDGKKQSCESTDIPKLKPQATDSENAKLLPFDRLSTEEVGKGVLVFYGDVTDAGFGSKYLEMVEAAEKAGFSYKLRYKPSSVSPIFVPVGLSGYGVSLVMKKTDYIVMDDRNVKEGSTASESVSEAPSTGDEAADIDTIIMQTQDIKPLSQRDLAFIGIRTMAYVMKSINPLETLNKVLQDFPKYASTLASTDATEELITEYSQNRETWLPSGVNLMWVNGFTLDESEVTAVALLEFMRRERKFIQSLGKLGLSNKESIDIITYPILTDSKAALGSQRFDWREQADETGAIVWLNDLEKDQKYSEWPETVNFLLRQTYPGQLHNIRKNLHNLIIPLDFSNRDDVELLVKQLSAFVQRGIAIRFGIVPLTHDNLAITNAKIFIALVDSYGLETGLLYFEQALEGDEYKMRHPQPEHIHRAVKGKTVREGKPAQELSRIYDDPELDAQVEIFQVWRTRLSVDTKPLPIFINGIAVQRGENWMQVMGQKLTGDVQILQEGVMHGAVTDDTDLVAFLLGENAASSRNVLLFPDEDSEIKMINLVELETLYPAVVNSLPYLPGTASEDLDTSVEDIWVIGDFDTVEGYNLLAEAAKYQASKSGISITTLHTSGGTTKEPELSALLYLLSNKEGLSNPGVLLEILREVKPRKDYISLPEIRKAEQDNLHNQAKSDSWAIPDKVIAGKFWSGSSALLHDMLKLKPGDRAVIMNGRLIGPLPATMSFRVNDFESLFSYEYPRRIQPSLQSAKDVGLWDKLGSRYAKSKLISLLTLIGTSEQPSGLFDRSTSGRLRKYAAWKGEHTAIKIGDEDSATFRIIVSLDPASEVAQKWVPILTTLSKMRGVAISIYLNPEQMINELPVKRFYRHVLDSKPSFDETGKMVMPRARFNGIPEQVLLSLSMDLPPSWLVAPAESIHDLDNIKIKTFKDRFGTADVSATYMLRNILIEGHSRDLTTGQAPAGAQLELGSVKNPGKADTLIMANLGYFQFKSNPGHWQIRLKPGRSSEVFSITSLGTKGYGVDDTDEELEITLMSFKGLTLFPKLKRKYGMETADVLAASGAGFASGIVQKGLNGIFSKIGFKNSKAIQRKGQADINVFSVASGHLYERFLNIMMVSVMRHTNQTVKFWFIENFLSPSFKDFIPLMAEEYKFEYELVTYKWPHWLRAQKEKQREIWGYKILFLDVLFPLDLEKVIFVDADQIVRTDLKDLVDLDLEGAPYGFTPMCDSRTEIEGFRFWKQGYWKNFLRGKPYHISALFVVDLNKFRQIAAGDRLRQQYHSLSADPNSLSNLDQDLPNHMQAGLPIFSLPQDWLWCETWCSDEALKTAKTIDLCNNPMTKEPKLDRARRQVPEWTEYDDEVAALAERKSAAGGSGVKNMREALVQKEALGEQEKVTVEKETIISTTSISAESALPRKDEL